MLWANKYRPTTFDEMVGGAKHIANVLGSKHSGHIYMQHLLLHSRGAGTGKTTTAYVLANELGYNLHVFNASSKRTRGIAFVEQELIPLTRAGIKNQIILLDEADQLTTEAQSALKGVIENADGYFILTCNDISKMSLYLQSRCLTIEIKEMSLDSMRERLEYICGAEGVQITLSQLDVICREHEGDLRNAINALQAFASFDDPTKAAQFINQLSEQEFDSKSFLKLTVSEKDMTNSLSMISERDTREIVRAVFMYAMDNPASQQKKIQVVDAAIAAERDVISGVDEDIIKANFVRMLIG